MMDPSHEPEQDIEAVLRSAMKKEKGETVLSFLKEAINSLG